MYGACIEDVNHEIYGGLYAQRIFGESFEEPSLHGAPQGWRAYGGDWMPTADGVYGRGGPGPKLVLENPRVENGTVEADVAISNDLGENAGLLVRVTDPGEGADAFSGYEVSLDVKHRRLILGKHQRDFRALAEAPAPVVPGRFHRLRVQMDSARLRVFLDDEPAPRIDFTDNDPLRGDAVALRTWHADATFRNVRIDGKGIRLDFAQKGLSRMWDRVGNASGSFRLEEGAFNGRLCQRIDHPGGKGIIGIANRGLNRWGISVRKDHPMEGRIHLHGSVDEATVALQSADGSVTYASQRLRVGKEWAKAPFRLRPNATDPKARFVLSFDRKGTLYADQAVLMDAREDRYRDLPVRKDIAEALLGSGVRFLRYGGTMVNVPGYRWKSMIGDPDRRPPYAGHWYPASTNGFGIFDFLEFCERAKIGAAFAINVDESPEDAADLADYLTASARNPWGRLRAKNGHPAPYRSDYIEIGNEEGIGNPDAIAMARYAERFRLLTTAIHRRNPNLKLVCGAWWVADSPAMRSVFEAVDGVAAAWDFHFWCDDPNAGKSVGRELDRARTLFQSWNPKSTLKAVVFEENGNRHDMARALGHASTMAATRARGDFVLADCAANALQPWHENDNGWDQGGVFLTSNRAWAMPPALVRRMLSEDALPLRIWAEGGSDTLATRSEDGHRLSVSLVNGEDRPKAIRIDLWAYRPRKAHGRAVSGALQAENPPFAPNKVTIRDLPVTLTPEGGTVTLPPHSVASLRFE